MKKITVFILLVMSFLAVLAGDVIKVLQVYSEGKKISIPVSNIDSLSYSMYNEDGTLNSDYVTSLTWTLDSVYQIPISKIDSMVIDEIDIDLHNSYIGQIMDYISSQEDMEMEVERFQNILLDWLKDKDFVQETFINDNKDFITINFVNGLSFYVDFQDIDSYVENDQNEMSNKRKKSTNEPVFIDVSSQPDESIIEKNKILYVKGMPMQRILGANYFTSEYDQLVSEIENSPIILEIVPEEHNPYFMKKGFDEYGMILISETHGLSDRPGWFQVEDPEKSAVKHYFGIRIYLKFNEMLNERFALLDQPLEVAFISPKSIADKITDPNLIVYGNYCWSYYLTRQIKYNTVYGFVTQSSHYRNIKRLVSLISFMANGLPYNQSIDLKSEPFWPLFGIFGSLDEMPKTNLDSKQRYFSIKTNDITFENGLPVISGQIKGYKNLKHDDFNYYILINKGDKEFTPMDDDFIQGKGSISVDSVSGEFVLNCFDKLEEGQKYGFMFLFGYGDKYYHGEVKIAQVPSASLCPDDNHPHAIDLGLPSGTKWACCNVGASTPEGYGGYYAWGETKEKPEYRISNYEYAVIDDDMFMWWEDGHFHNCTDIGSNICGTDKDVAQVHEKWGGSWQMPSLEQIKELLSNCTYRWTKINGINGQLLSSRNSNGCIFLPASGSRFYESDLYIDSDSDDTGYHGYYWSGTRSSNSYKEAYFLTFDYDYATWGGYGDRYYGLSVRPVTK